MTPSTLRRWRLNIFPGGTTKDSITDAAAWYGCSTRAWQYYEAGQRPIPLPLERRIKDFITH